MEENTGDRSQSVVHKPKMRDVAARAIWSAVLEEAVLAAKAGRTMERHIMLRTAHRVSLLDRGSGGCYPSFATRLPADYVQKQRGFS